MTGEGPALALLARLDEAARWEGRVRDYEPDPWGYMRRKLGETREPLAAVKRGLFEAARRRLLDDLKERFLKPGALEEHKETFERLLPPADFADLAFQLEPGRDAAARREAVASILKDAKPRTLFDLEALPPERRPKEWRTLVSDLEKRLDLPRLAAVLARRPVTDARRRAVARRLRRNLGEYLAVTRAEHGVRTELTPFVLSRLEAAIAALLRYLDRG